MKSKLEADFQYYGHWTFALLAATLTFSLSYFNLLSQKNNYSLKVGLMSVAFLILYSLFERKYNKVYNNLRKTLRGGEETMKLGTFWKTILNKDHIMNYTYGFFGSIFAASFIAFVLKQFPKPSDMYSWYVISIIAAITYIIGLFCVSIIAFAFNKKIKT